MAEYIEREKALDFISEVEPIICMPPDNKPPFTAVKDPDMVAYLESIPAADVRPVVMCRDCEYWKQWDNTTHYLCTYVAGAKFIRNAEDFCSRGEKREES